MRSASATASAKLSAARRLFRTSSAEPGSNSPRLEVVGLPAQSIKVARCQGGIGVQMATSKPAIANTWAMPPPMYPAPITAMSSIIGSIRTAKSTALSA